MPLIAAGGSGGGVGGSTGATDNRALRSDGAGGATAQNSLVQIQDDGTIVANALLVYDGADLSNDEKVQVAASFLMASDVHVKWYNDTDISSGSVVVGLTRDSATNTLKVTNGAAGDGRLRIGGLRVMGFTSSAAGASTTELPNDKDCSIHKNTGTSAVHLAYNDGGVIKAVQLT